MNYPKHSTETYKGIEIEIEYDQYAENPFEKWDGCTPLISVSNNGQEDYSKGEIISYLRNYLTYNQVKRHQVKLLNLIGYNVVDFKNDYPFDRTEQIKDDLLYNWLDESIRNMEKFCIEFDIKHYRGHSTGYSQSDWADIFMCWTPEFGEVTGRTYESIDDDEFKGGLKLYSDWAWGDVYSYSIEETGDSCYGFYGDDFETSGLMEYAKNNIDCYLADKKKTKQSKLKALIKNKVPYQKRTEILTAI